MHRKNTLWSAALLLAVVSVGVGCKNTAKSDKAEFKTETEKVSYILGFSTGKSLADQSIEIDQKVFESGMTDGLSKDEKAAKMTDEEMRETMMSFRTNLMEKRKKERDEAAGKNKEAGDKFLADNKAKPGVQTTASGLQYKIVTAGTGAKPTDGDSVVVEYKGTLLNGKVFDSTEERGEPATFPVNATIQGMSEALKLMPAGSKWEIYIPAALAYGEQGAGAMIGPNETLIFELKLDSIKKPEGKAEAKPEAKPAVKK